MSRFLNERSYGSILTNRPLSGSSKPRPLVSRGQGGCSSSIAKRRDRKLSNPPSSNVFHQQNSNKIPTTTFRKFYDRGDLPLSVNFSGASRRLKWAVDVEMLDLHIYLPIMFDGLREIKEPYKFIADKAVDEMLEKCPHKVLPVLPQLIIPIKLALETRIQEVIVRTLKKLQKLVRCGYSIAESIVPYYRQILPTFNLFKNKRVSIGDHIEYSQYKDCNISDLIQETLELFETYGGEEAYINIKYMIPTYESCMF